MQGQPELPAYPAQSASPERQSQREPSLPLEAPSWEKVSLASDGGVYAVFSPAPSPQTERILKQHTHPRRKPGSLFLSDLPQSPPALFPPSGLRFGDFFPVYGYLS